MIASRTVDSPALRVPPKGLARGALPKARSPRRNDAMTRASNTARVNSRPTTSFTIRNLRRGTGATRR
jgi:hypothetical protein